MEKCGDRIDGPSVGEGGCREDPEEEENEEKRQKCQENRSGPERGILFRRMRIITLEYCWGED